MDKLTQFRRWLVAFAFEHVCFLVKFVVSYIIPDVPSDVQFKMRKVRFDARSQTFPTLFFGFFLYNSFLCFTFDNK